MWNLIYNFVSLCFRQPGICHVTAPFTFNFHRRIMYCRRFLAQESERSIPTELNKKDMEYVCFSALNRVICQFLLRVNWIASKVIKQLVNLYFDRSSSKVIKCSLNYSKIFTWVTRLLKSLLYGIPCTNQKLSFFFSSAVQYFFMKQ